MKDSAVNKSYFTQARVRAEVDDTTSIVYGLSPALWKAASKMKRPHSWEIDDLMQIGMLAALECRPKYNPERGDFGAFARMVAIRAMQDASNEARGSVRIPATTATRRTPWMDIAREHDRTAVALDASNEHSDGSQSSKSEVVHGILPEMSVDDRVDTVRILRKMSARDLSYFLAEAEGTGLRDLPDVVAGHITLQGVASRKQYAIAKALDGTKP